MQLYHAYETKLTNHLRNGAVLLSMKSFIVIVVYFSKWPTVTFMKKQIPKKLYKMVYVNINGGKGTKFI